MYERALGQVPGAALSDGKGTALFRLSRYEEALLAYDQAIKHNPKWVKVYADRGATLWKLGRAEEALAAFEQAIELDSNSALACAGKGLTLYFLVRFE